MTRRNVEVRRDEILAATVVCIAESGLSQTRVKDVARQLGVSTALVFYHFETKDALLAAAFEHAVEQDLSRLDRTLARGHGSTDRLRRLLATYGPTGSAEGWRLWIDAWALALREPTIRTALRRLDKRWRDALESTVRDGVESGDFSCPDPAAATARIGALLDGLSVSALLYGSVSRQRLRTWIREAAAIELGVPAAVLL
ncbi:MAG: TetR/AcrR family transcriptional regulator [Nocardioidaceae bacterium]